MESTFKIAQQPQKIKMYIRNTVIGLCRGMFTKPSRNLLPNRVYARLPGRVEIPKSRIGIIAVLDNNQAGFLISV